MSELIKRVREAVANRARILIPDIEKKPFEDWFDYSGYRTAPENLGWRFQQRLRIRGKDDRPDPERIREGEFDSEIESTFHEAAGAQYYYTYEKDWG